MGAAAASVLPERTYCSQCKEDSEGAYAESTGEKKQLTRQQATVEFLKTVPLLQELTVQQHAAILDASVVEERPEGHVFLKQGAVSSELHIVVDGQVLLGIHGRIVGFLRSGDCFGQTDLTAQKPCDETIIAEVPTVVLKVNARRLREMELADKIMSARPRVLQMHAGASKSSPSGSSSGSRAKTPEELRMMADGFRANKSLSGLLEWDDKQCGAIADLAFEEVVEAGRELTLGKDDGGLYFYIVKEGSLEILIEVSHEGAEREVEHVGMVSKGGVFGEVALVCQPPRSMALAWVALEKSTCWVIELQHVLTLIARQAAELEETSLRLIEQVDFFTHLPDSEKQLLAKAMVRLDFSKGEDIYKMGDEGDSFYILYSGVVVAVKSEMVVRHISASADFPVTLGEMALLNEETRSETTEVISLSAKTLFMEKVTFEALLGPTSLANWSAKHPERLLAPVENWMGKNDPSVLTGPQP